MFWEGLMLDSKAVWVHLASLKLNASAFSEFQARSLTLHLRGLPPARTEICQAKTICRKSC